jgi:hypothetical protein
MPIVDEVKVDNDDDDNDDGCGVDNDGDDGGDEDTPGGGGGWGGTAYAGAETAGSGHDDGNPVQRRMPASSDDNLLLFPHLCHRPARAIVAI